MKKLIALSLMALCCATTQAKPDTTDDTSVKQLAKADGFYFMSCPEATIDKKTKKKTVVWHDTENNSWHENIGFVKDIPTISSLESIFPRGIHVSPNNVSYIPAAWKHLSMIIRQRLAASTARGWFMILLLKSTWHTS